MNLLSCARLALPILLCGFLSQAFAQAAKTNSPFSWKESSDPWYTPKAYSFKYLSDEFTEKGGQTIKTAPSHGPVNSADCKESTSPATCTASLLTEKFKAVPLPNATIPSGYSGVEYVTFDVQTNGKVNGYQVVKQQVLCKPCIQAAVNQVAALGEWHPAIQDGIFVKSTVVVPVYFK